MNDGSPLAALLSKLPVANFRLRFQPKEILLLPGYKGSTIRGAFGVTFRRIACVNRGVKDCSACLLTKRWAECKS